MRWPWCSSVLPCPAFFLRSLFAAVFIIALTESRISSGKTQTHYRSYQPFFHCSSCLYGIIPHTRQKVYISDIATFNFHQPHPAFPHRLNLLSARSSDNSDNMSAAFRHYSLHICFTWPTPCNIFIRNALTGSGAVLGV